VGHSKESSNHCKVLFGLEIGNQKWSPGALARTSLG
jgi:hypothetical protein